MISILKGTVDRLKGTVDRRFSVLGAFATAKK
jgi:hypothetical protein